MPQGRLKNQPHNIMLRAQCVFHFFSLDMIEQLLYEQVRIIFVLNQYTVLLIDLVFLGAVHVTDYKAVIHLLCPQVVDMHPWVK